MNHRSQHNCAPLAMVGMLKEVIELLRIPRAEMADALALSPTTLTRALRNNRPTSREEYNRIVDYLANYRVHLPRL